MAEYTGTGSSNIPNTDAASFGHLGIQGGHTGPSSTQSVSGGLDRYVIAAYTIQYSAEYQISNSYLNRNPGSCGNGIILRIFVNDNQVYGPITVTAAGTIYFDMNLNHLFGGDVVSEL